MRYIILILLDQERGGLSGEARNRVHAACGAEGNVGTSAPVMVIVRALPHAPHTDSERNETAKGAATPRGMRLLNDFKDAKLERGPPPSGTQRLQWDFRQD